ncbi:hypothetical protein NE848_11035 [Gramella jeungdoensis]|uniref:DUF4369 domain-containing protein n=1 Tax=Gramella jeungdoensis TaxID=708091 RepID=A0ABT0Z2G0_9FLAO|nr:hypothetical protein [Gramella jeungdoensis]MCM8569915.1 hypothetical protein [Gramella jeungdoensis]
MFRKQAILLCCSLFIFSIGNSQTAEKVYEVFDSRVGLENTVLFNGFQYQDPVKTINDNNKFLFPGNEYSNGEVSYSGHYFFDVKLKFNLVDDRLFIKIAYDSTSAFFQLITEKIDSFIIRDIQFIRLDYSEEVKGFYQKLFSSKDYSLYKKYRKDSNEKHDKSFFYYEYKFTDPQYVLIYNEKPFQANSRRDVIDIFPDKKSEIKQFYKEQKSLSKRDMDAFMENLLKGIINQNIKSR